MSLGERLFAGVYDCLMAGEEKAGEETRAGYMESISGPNPGQFGERLQEIQLDQQPTPLVP